MDEQRHWDLLVESLSGLGSVERRPDGLRVVMDAATGGRAVDIVMNLEQWDDIVAIPFGDLAEAINSVHDAIHELASDKSFLVYHQYDLVPSATATLPIDPERERFRKWMRENPGATGQWFANPPGEARDGSD